MKYSIAFSMLLTLSGLLHGQSRFEVSEAGILEIQTALVSGQVTSVELVQKYLARIAAYDQQGPKLNSLVRVNSRALEIATALDTERRISGPRGPLHGIPIILKDNYNTVDMPTTGSSVALAGFTPSASATQVDRLVDAGAIILAKSNLHEFAYGITSVGSLAGQTRNPYDPRRVPGGSSGGTAAAIAASFGAVGMGSDTCGSIRIPSAYNNLVGLRPSKGLSSIHGVMPLSHTQDVAGPLARSVTDLALVLDVVAGYDPRDYATAIMSNRPSPEFFANLNSESLAGLRLGRLNDYMTRADSNVARVIDEALEELAVSGVEIVELDAPGLGSLVAQSGLIGFEFQQDINDYFITFGSSRIGSLREVVQMGLYHEAIQNPLTRSLTTEFDEQAYLQAHAARSELRVSLEELLTTNDLDALVYPPIGELPVFTGESQPGNNCSLSANSGLPAISVPAGFSTSGLPVGLELLGHFMSDTRLVSIAYRIEQLLRPRKAPIATPVLKDSLAPGPLQSRWHYNQSGLNVTATFTYDQTLRQLQYQVINESKNPEDVFSLALMIDDAPVGELDDPVVATVLSPGAASAQDLLFVRAGLHQAMTDDRLYVRLFAEGIPVQGISEVLDFNR